MRRALGLALAAAACAACSLIVSLDDLAVQDGGTDAAPDVATDVASDVVVPPDAGASDAPFCKQADHSLCDDFDESPLGALWTSQHVTTATLALDDAAAASPPRSLLASVPAQGGNAFLQKDFTGSASRVTCQLDARMDSLQSVPILSFEIGLASTDPNRVGYDVTLLHTSAKTSYSEWTGFPDGGGASVSADLPALPASAWTHIVVDLNFGAGSIDVKFDGASVLSTTLTPPPNDGQTLLLGVLEYTATAATMHFDNVACDVTP